MMVSIVIVNFNCGSLLVDCVRSCLNSTVPVQVFVSDNGSVDDSIEKLKKEIIDERLVIHLNHANLGFAKGSNVVLPLAKGDFILFLNPDCMIKPDTIEKMLQEMALKPEVGMAGCLIRNLDGSEQAGCRRRVPTPWRTLVRMLWLDRLFPNHPKFESVIMHQKTLPKEVVCKEAISGAFMFVRRTAMEQVGFLDEGYFLHCEDLDWCMRFRQKKWQILFVPHVEVSHVKGGCSVNRPIRVEWHKHKGMVRFYLKFFRHQYPWPLMLLVVTSVWVRFVILCGVLTMKRFFR
ncbi:MAG: glycosyltransferase family 2 protein [Mariprofundaceae bacterium]|nr:glycosyltransferase family 2 protein [Mariprofundaceae bacterium]